MSAACFSSTNTQSWVRLFQGTETPPLPHPLPVWSDVQGPSSFLAALLSVILPRHHPDVSRNLKKPQKSDSTFEKRPGTFLAGGN